MSRGGSHADANGDSYHGVPSSLTRVEDRFREETRNLGRKDQLRAEVSGSRAGKKTDSGIEKASRPIRSPRRGMGEAVPRKIASDSAGGGVVMGLTDGWVFYCPPKWAHV